jgi:two-component system, OmpR family, response regulator
MLPKTLALIDDDEEYVEFLAQYLRQHGVEVTTFTDSNELLAHSDAFGFAFYVVDLMMPGIGGLDLITVLRKRSNAGVVVVSGRLSPDVFREVVDVGADMYLAKPVQFEQVALAVRAVQRRAVAAAPPSAGWGLDKRARQLLAPDGARVDLSDTDLGLLQCFVEAEGQVVQRELLRQRLGRPDDVDGNKDGLNAVVFRLRRRIERATPALVPLQAKSGVGYVFRAPLRVL